MSQTPTTSDEDPQDEQPGGVVDLPSVLYVVCGVPLMALFFVVFFGLVGACDQANVMIPG